MELNLKMGQCWSGAGHGPTCVLTSLLFTWQQSLLSFYLFVFPCLFLPKSSESPPYLAFGSSPWSKRCFGELFPLTGHWGWGCPWTALPEPKWGACSSKYLIWVPWSAFGTLCMWAWALWWPESSQSKGVIQVSPTFAFVLFCLCADKLFYQLTWQKYELINEISYICNILKIWNGVAVRYMKTCWNFSWSMSWNSLLFHRVHTSCFQGGGKEQARLLGEVIQISAHFTFFERNLTLEG